MTNKFKKFLTLTKKNGVFSTIKRAFLFIINYYIKTRIFKRIIFFKNKKNLLNFINEILMNNNFDRIIIYRGSIGWNIPMFQRPQQMALSLGKQNCLVFYEVTNRTDKIDFIKKESDNVYLINYDLREFNDFFLNIINKLVQPKYLLLYSTCWDLEMSLIKYYQSNSYKIIYEYIDELNYQLAGLSSLPDNVMHIYDYMMVNEDIYIVTSATKLYNCAVEKRGNTNRIVLSSNGVDFNHFFNFEKKFIYQLEEIGKKYSLIVGYYGALASWFDYDILKKMAKNNPKVAFLLIGIEYDQSLKMSHIDKYENIYYLGAINYNELPFYAHYFDIAWIPFLINEITLSTNPIKVFEYMALQKFIVTSDLPECHKYKSVNIAKNIDDYQFYIDNYSRLMTKNYIKTLISEAKQNSWDYKARDLINLLEDDEKC